MAISHKNGIALTGVSAINGVTSISAINGISASLGASSAWYDSTTLGATSEDGALSDGFTVGTIVTPGQSGNVTKLRIWIVNSGSSLGVMKMGLFVDATGALVTSGSYTTGTAPGGDWVEVTVTPAAVTSGTAYRIGFVAQIGTSFTTRAETGRPTNDSGYNTTLTYSAWATPPSTFTYDAGLSRGYLAGMFVE